jgi:2-C-methyl-D-erythritol 4-phosphate cytidylyltransferase
MNAAIIAAGGVAERFGASGGKQLALVAGEPVLVHTVRAFDACSAVDAIVIVTHPARVSEYLDALGQAIAGKVVAVVAGGDTRRESVAAGIRALPDDTAFIAVHDGARAAVTPDVIAGAFSALAADATLDGVVVGHPAFDTIKRVESDRTVIDTPDRSQLWVAQTPQVFRAPALRAAHAAAAADGFEGTDDASLVERAGGRIAMVAGPRWNLKVTVPEDIEVLETLLAIRGKVDAT